MAACVADNWDEKDAPAKLPEQSRIAERLPKGHEALETSILGETEVTALCAAWISGVLVSALWRPDCTPVTEWILPLVKKLLPTPELDAEQLRLTLLTVLTLLFSYAVLRQTRKTEVTNIACATALGIMLLGRVWITDVHALLLDIAPFGVNVGLTVALALQEYHRW